MFVAALDRVSNLFLTAFVAALDRVSDRVCRRNRLHFEPLFQPRLSPHWTEFLTAFVAVIECVFDRFSDRVCRRN